MEPVCTKKDIYFALISELFKYQFRQTFHQKTDWCYYINIILHQRHIISLAIGNKCSLIQQCHDSCVDVGCHNKLCQVLINSLIIQHESFYEKTDIGNIIMYMCHYDFSSTSKLLSTTVGMIKLQFSIYSKRTWRLLNGFNVCFIGTMEMP